MSRQWVPRKALKIKQHEQIIVRKYSKPCRFTKMQTVHRVLTAMCLDWPPTNPGPAHFAHTTDIRYCGRQSVMRTIKQRYNWHQCLVRRDLIRYLGKNSRRPDSQSETLAPWACLTLFGCDGIPRIDCRLFFDSPSVDDVSFSIIFPPIFLTQHARGDANAFHKESTTPPYLAPTNTALPVKKKIRIAHTLSWRAYIRAHKHEQALARHASGTDRQRRSTRRARRPLRHLFHLHKGAQIQLLRTEPSGCAVRSKRHPLRRPLRPASPLIDSQQRSPEERRRLREHTPSSFPTYPRICAGSGRKASARTLRAGRNRTAGGQVCTQDMRGGSEGRELHCDCDFRQATASRCVYVTVCVCVFMCVCMCVTLCV